MKKSLLVSVLVIFSGFVNAQFSIEKRITIEERNLLNHCKVLLVSDQEVIVTYEKFAGGNMLDIHFERYDTALQKISDKTVKIQYKLAENKITESNGRKGHVLCHDFDGDFVLITYNGESNNVRKVSGKLPKNFKAKELVSTGKIVYLAGYSKDENTLITIDEEKGLTGELNLPFKEFKASYYRGHQIQKNTNRILFYYLSFPTKKSSDIIIVQADSLGKVNPVINSSEKVEPLILSEKIAFNNGKDNFMVGAYSNETRFFPQGLFWQPCEGLNIASPVWFPFSTIQNFDNTCKQQNGKVEQGFGVTPSFPGVAASDYNIVLHEPVVADDSYFVIGELFYNTFNASDDPTRSGTYFSGFQYTHSIILKLDNTGKVIWSDVFPSFIKNKPYMDFPMNHNFNFNPPVPYTLINTKLVTNNEIPLLYLNSNKVVNRLYNKDGKFVKEQENEIALNLMNDKNDKLLNSDLAFWYGSCYVVFGTVANKKTTNDEFTGKFFIEKIKM